MQMLESFDNQEQSGSLLKVDVYKKCIKSFPVENFQLLRYHLGCRIELINP